MMATFSALEATAPFEPTGPAALPRLVASMLRPEAYPHPAGQIALHETHISWVILAGPYAYKLKKPVNLGFVDFSTVARRATACAEEVRLNRRLCPDVYLGVADVVELAGRPGEYAIGGPGRQGGTIEPAVRMRRLPEAGMLPALLARDAVDARLVGRIAARLASFHAGAATGPGVDAWGAPDAVRANWEESFAQVAPFVGRALPADRQETIAAYVRRFLAEQGPLLARRVAAGRIRDGHGDLHAANVCVEGRRLQLFDCLEFSPRYRCADVAAEVAFLAMDLARRGRADLADAFIRAYVRASGDEGLAPLLPFYACYRAYVRGKVLALRMAEPGLAPERTDELAAEARGYFDLAWANAGGLAAPLLVVVMGPPASGKTTLATALACQLGLIHLSSDVTRKRLAGLGPHDHQEVGFRRGLYSPAMTHRTYAALRRQAARWLRQGRSVVLDATYGARAERAEVRRLAARARARLDVFVCEADEATLRARLAAREGDPLVTSDARLGLWPALRRAYSPPVELPRAIPVDMTAPLGEAVDRAVARLAEGGART